VLLSRHEISPRGCEVNFVRVWIYINREINEKPAFSTLLHIWRVNCFGGVGVSNT
jgi:hypothetical protein